MERAILASVCALVLAVYLLAAHSSIPRSGRMGAADNYYNLLVQGFRAGQLSLKKEVPPGLVQLADPYDPEAHAAYPVFDMSYYKGKFYLYFGVTPAVALFWPYVALTGHYLSQEKAAVVFCFVGFLASVGLLWALWRRYFADVNVAAVAIGGFALGLATFAPFVLARIDVYEVAISCGYMLTMLALAAIWKAVHETESRRRSGWLAVASLFYGLAVGARPNLLFGAVILLVPVVRAWRERGGVAARKHGPPKASVAAAVIPITLIGLGLMVYNALRFDSPFDFGARYQLGAVSVLTTRLFSLRYLWFNFRVYFLEPARWSSRFPFAHDIRVPPLPAGHWPTEHPFGVLTDIPLVWLALAVPLAWRGRADHRQGRVEWEFEASLCHPLGGFLAAIVTLFGISALTLGLFFYTAARYEMEFVPPLVLLAVIGILSLERTLSPIAEPRCGNRGESGQAHRLGCRRAARWGWSLLLVFSVAFNLLASFGQIAEAHNNLGIALAQQGKVIEAVEQYDQALRVSPDYAAAHNDLASALMRQGRLQGAIEHYEQAVRLEPDFAEAHYNLGNALLQAGRVQDAIDHYERAVRIAPDFVAANYNLGNAFARTGRMQAAIGPWEQALRIRPDFAEAHYSLGVALEQAGRVQDAIRHYEQALRIKPELVPARNALAKARAAR